MKVNSFKGFLLLLLCVLGLSEAKAYTEGFDNFKISYDSSWKPVLTLPEGWDYYGDGNTFSRGSEKDTYKTSLPSIGVEATNATAYLITPMLQGDFDFFIRNYTSKKQAQITAYACTYQNGELVRGEQIDYKKLTSGNSNWYNVTFNSTTATRVALLISQAYFDDFTYKPATAVEGPSLVVNGFTNGSEFDFGTVAEGTSKSFSLINQGTADLEIESITVSGDFTLSDNLPSVIAAGKSVDISISTPANDTTGVLSIVSNDEENSPYEIKLKSQYKVPKPIMAVSLSEINLGKVTEDATGTFSVSNTGDAPLEVSLSSNNEAFELNSSSLTVKAGEKVDVTVTFHFNAEVYGVNSANITLHPNEGDDAEVKVYARVANPNVWTENFSANEVPSGWEADKGGWSFDGNVAKGEWSYGTKYYLTTPDLIVEAGDELEFQYRPTASRVTINIQYSKDGGEFKDYPTGLGYLNKSDNFSDYTIKNLEAGSYRFRFQNEDYELDNFEGFILNLNAPKLEVSPLEDAVFGKVTSGPVSKTYEVKNIGTGLLTVNITSSSDDFTVEPAEIKDIEPENPVEFTVTFNHDIDKLGEKEALITVTPSYNSLAAVTFKASAIAKNPYLWEEDFEEGEIPEGWSNTGWTIEKPKASTYNNGTYMAYAGTSSSVPVITTPRLWASEGQELSFEIGNSTDSYDPMTVEYSHDQIDWTPIEDSPIKAGGTYTFTAPETGYYYLRFQGKYGRIDNFLGFRLALKDHDISISGQNIPAAGHQYVDYTASVTLKEMTGKEEKANVSLYFGEEQVATAETTLEPDATLQVELSFLPVKAYENVEASIVITYAEGETLRGENVTVTVSEAPVWSENEDNDFESTTIPALVFDYTVNEGWNTISVPFALDDSYLEQIFGPRFEVYELGGYEDNTIKFRSALKNNGKYAPGYPYVVHIPNVAVAYDVEEDEEVESSTPIILKDVKIEQPTPQEERKGLVAFKGSFNSGSADTDLYELNAQGALDSNPAIRAFRAYISLDPQIETVPEVKFYDGSGVETGVSMNYSDSVYPEGIYNLNGIRVSEPLVPGIYIINGKKVILRGH